MANEKRLIDANELVSLMKYYDEQQRTDMWETSEIEHLLGEIPTVKAVEVVRCKDCKHFYKSISSDRDGRCEQFGTYDADPSVYLTDFCSYGERRTENGNQA